MHEDIEIIEDNSGALFIQNTNTGEVAYYESISKDDDGLVQTLESILDGDEMCDWDLHEEDRKHFITTEHWIINRDKYVLWDEEEIEDFLTGNL